MQPLLGPNTPSVDGWLSAYVRIENHSGEVVRGTLAVDAEANWALVGSGAHNRTEVPFSVAARSQVAVEVPVHGFPNAAPGLRVVARAADGSVLADAKAGELRTSDPLIFDLSSPSHVAPALRDLAVPVSNPRWGG